MDNKKIGEFICNERKAKKLTQEELAKLIPIGRQAVSKWETGVSVPDVETLKILSDIFDVSINEILAGERKNAENKNVVDGVTLGLYKRNRRNKKVFKVLFALILIVVLVASFSISYICKNWDKWQADKTIAEIEGTALMQLHISYIDNDLVKAKIKENKKVDIIVKDAVNGINDVLVTNVAIGFLRNDFNESVKSKIQDTRWIGLMIPVDPVDVFSTFYLIKGANAEASNVSFELRLSKNQKGDSVVNEDLKNKLDEIYAENE